MTNFHNLVLAKYFNGDPRLSVKKTFFGLCKKYYYSKTDSMITACKKEYTPSEGYKIEQAINADAANRVAKIAALGKIAQTTMGNYMLEMCWSADNQFAALQLNQFKQLSYEPVTPVCIFEGKDADTVINAF